MLAIANFSRFSMAGRGALAGDRLNVCQSNGVILASPISIHRRARSPYDCSTAIGDRLMSKPLVVTIPHRLGKEEAVRRLKSGLGGVRTNFGHLLAVQQEVWTGDHLEFQVSALGQAAGGIIDVAEDHVRLEVTLPWLLAKLAEKIQPMIRQQGTLMLKTDGVRLNRRIATDSVTSP